MGGLIGSGRGFQVHRGWRVDGDYRAVRADTERPVRRAQQPSEQRHWRLGSPRWQQWAEHLCSRCLLSLPGRWKSLLRTPECPLTSVVDS